MSACRLLPLLAAIALLLPLGAWPQQPARLPTVGILSAGAPLACESGALGFLAARLVEGQRALGHVEGRTVAFETRYANGDFSRRPALASELVALRPDVLYTFTVVGAEAAAKATGQTIGTGINDQSQKCLQLLKELAPRTLRVAWIRNPDNPGFIRGSASMDAAATQLGLTLVHNGARNAADLPQAFAAITAGRAEAIFMGDDAALAGSGEVRKLVNAWALSRSMPLASSNAGFVADGAPLSLGADIPAIARRAAFYVHRILGGAKPGDLPVERPTVFKLSLNRNTAAAMGTTIPQSLLLRADGVIQ